MIKIVQLWIDFFFFPSSLFKLIHLTKLESDMAENIQVITTIKHAHFIIFSL